MSKEDYDVIIIGGGISGLTCGCYLQRAGLKVAIFDASEEAGGGRKTTDIMRPGYLVQPHVWWDVEPYFPNQLDLELDKFGYQDVEMASEWGVGKIYSDGTCLMNHNWDTEKTAQKFERISPEDGDLVRNAGAYFNSPYAEDDVSTGVKLLELMFTEPWTWENWDKLLNIVAPVLPFDDPYEICHVNGFEILDMLIKHPKVKTFSMVEAINGVFYPFFQGGFAAIAQFASILSGMTGHAKHGSHSIVHVYNRAFRAYGGEIFTSSPVEKIMVEDGKAKGVRLSKHAAYPRGEATAKIVISDVNAVITLVDMVGKEHVPYKTIQQLKTNYQWEGLLFTVNYAVKERPRFAAEEYDPDIDKTIAGMMGKGSEYMNDVILSHGQRMAGRIPDNISLTYLKPMPGDPTQNAEGNATCGVWIEVPWYLAKYGGVQMWDNKNFRNSLAEKTIDVWEEYSPGFRKNLLDYWISTPLDHQRYNPNFTHGDMVVGSISQVQMMYANRPGAQGFDKGGIVTPIDNLYMCQSNGITWSGGSNGYKTAVHVAEELGIRNQPWWKHRMFDYITKKYVEKSYKPLKPSSILDDE